ncbi:hypothetical protein GCM10027082_38030 [Comamonas humi]
MHAKTALRASLLTFAALAASQVQAANQCLKGPGTYGSLTVGGCATSTDANGVGVIADFAQVVAGYPYAGLALNLPGLGSGPESLSCTYTFSHPVLRSSVTVSLDVLDPDDVLAVSFDGTPYGFTSADLVQAPLPSSYLNVSTGTPVFASGTVKGASPPASGALQLRSSGPQWVSSMTLTMSNQSGFGGGAVTGVCVDDAPPPPPVTAAAPVPGLWPGAVALLGLLLAGSAAVVRRRQRRR